MHILLTDLLTCPRCGPEFGLIVLADAMADRRVLEGHLGCANCRNEYPIRGGVADLRLDESATRDPHAGEGAAPLERLDAERSFRLAALLGVGERGGAVLIHGGEPSGVAAVARLLPNAQVFGSSFGDPPQGAGSEVSWVVHGSSLPMRDRSLLTAGFLGAAAAEMVPLSASKVFGAGHIVLDGTPLSALPDDPSAPWSILLEQQGVAVASRTRAG